MEKLTLEYLEQIVPYLPYELQMKAIEGTMIYTAKGINICSENWILIKDKNGFDCQIKNIKPILRPLLDLTQEDGISEISTIITFTEYHCDNYDEWESIFIENPSHQLLQQAPYLIAQNLFKYHFDVFGLIPKGLAIDINTLK